MSSPWTTFSTSNLRSPDRWCRSLVLSSSCTLLGEPEKAVVELDSLLSRPGWISVSWLKMDPRWNPLRGNPRFEALLAKYELKH